MTLASSRSIHHRLGRFPSDETIAGAGAMDDKPGFADRYGTLGSATHQGPPRLREGPTRQNHRAPPSASDDGPFRPAPH